MLTLSLLQLTHLIGLVLGVGAGTVKLILLIKCNSDYSFFPAYFRISKLITRTIVIGVFILTLSGIAWLLLGYGFTRLLIVKIILVAGIWVLGIIIDNAIEPKLEKLFSPSGESPSPEFIRVQKFHLILETIADVLFYLIIIIWVMR